MKSRLTKSAGDHFEELLNNPPIAIKELLKSSIRKDGQPAKKYPSGWRMKDIKIDLLPNGILNGGVYVFWWLGNTEESREVFLKNICSFNIKGKKIKGINKINEIIVKVDNSWLQLYGKHIPLYVRKTEESIYERTRKHLKINQKEYTGNTTTDQLRKGINELFCNCKDTSSLIVDNIGISYINLHGAEEAINRFYLENYAIGKLMPIINVDVER
ncbi:hypothetical protein [Aquibacillus saliphilus]|uniref:hypothetical protein n=1 Tax=Aquibacillus saliphilus TaxID=1909422 RepID=UPI001CEFB420|nr:hypothetical protein [Aquibacillus saliphilus]